MYSRNRHYYKAVILQLEKNSHVEASGDSCSWRVPWILQKVVYSIMDGRGGLQPAWWPLLHLGVMGYCGDPCCVCNCGLAMKPLSTGVLAVSCSSWLCHSQACSAISVNEKKRLAAGITVNCCGHKEFLYFKHIYCAHLCNSELMHPSPRWAEQLEWRQQEKIVREGCAILASVKINEDHPNENTQRFLFQAWYSKGLPWHRLKGRQRKWEVSWGKGRALGCDLMDVVAIRRLEWTS